MARTQLRLVPRSEMKTIVRVAGPEAAVVRASRLTTLSAAVRRVAQWLWPAQVIKRRQHMRLLETLPLDARHRLMLVHCEGERFLVGTGPENVTALVRVRPEAPHATDPGPGNSRLVEPWA